MRSILLLLLFLCFMANQTVLADEESVYLLINKSTNQLTVMLNNSPVFHFSISTGRSANLTPEGTYSVIRKVKNPWYIPKNIPGGDPNNPVGTRWIGLDVPGTNGYKYGIHGTNNQRSIGSYESEGCIRMKNREVEWLFRHIPLGTKVIIH